MKFPLVLVSALSFVFIQNAYCEVTKEDLEIIRAIVRENQMKNEIPIGTILPFAGNGMIPADYLPCDGRALPKPGQAGGEYQTIFAVIGETYTPENEKNGPMFKLPDLRGRTAIGEYHRDPEEIRKRGPEGYALDIITEGIVAIPRHLGQHIGSEKTKLEACHMPKHVHGPGSFKIEGGDHGLVAILGNKERAPIPSRQYMMPMNEITAFDKQSSHHAHPSNEWSGCSSEAGDGIPHDNMQPSLVIRYIIKVK